MTTAGTRVAGGAAAGRVPDGRVRDGRLSAGSRRGAVIPLVCVLLTVLIGAAALALDLGRLYYAGVEAQTAADAAALAAARAQQWYPRTGAGFVQGYADETAQLNRAGGQNARALAADVLPMDYEPKTRTLSPSTWTENTTAVQVTAQVKVDPIFGGIFNDTAHVVRRKAAAWIANVNGINCVRPFSINYTRFYEEGVTWDSRYTSVGATAPEFVQWDISNTQYPPLANRTFTFLGPDRKEQTWDDQGYFNNGNWRPVSFAGGGLSAFTNQLGAETGSALCPTMATAVGDTKQPLVADTTGVLASMHTGMAALCHRAGNAPDAHCYDAKGNVGVRTRLMFSDSVKVGASYVYRVREVAVARVMCYWRATTDICNDVPMNEPNARGTWTLLGGRRTGYPPGTISILMDCPSTIPLSPDVVLGTKPSITQRVVLVK